LVIEYPSMKAYGSSYDQLMKDDEIASVMAAVDGADSPYTTQRAIAESTEIPIGTTPKRGPVLTAAIARPVPGRSEDAVAALSRVGAVMGRLGASARLFQLGAAGLQSGSLGLAVEYPSMAARGGVLDALATDNEGRAVLAEGLSASSPITRVSQDVFTELQL
jgi:hypothetical protein